MKYYSDTGANLLSLEQFLYRLMTEPDYVFNATTGLCKVTVYANEYFYERNPMQENAPQTRICGRPLPMPKTGPSTCW
mgnify:CR=1 FL=1